LSALALDATIAASVDVRTARLADETGREWARRFRAASKGRQNP
jgi:Stf0 sulphotransferase